MMPVFDENNKLKFIKLSDVYSICREHKTRKFIITAASGKFYIPSTIKEVNEILDPLGFQLIDKNKIINVSHVKSFKDGNVTLDGSTYIVSRRNLKRLEERLKN